MRIAPPEGLASGESVEASLSADLDNDGDNESAWLVRDTADSLWLRIEASDGSRGSRLIMARDGTSDMRSGPAITRFGAVRLFEGGGLELTVGLEQPTGDAAAEARVAWALYRHIKGDVPALLRLEPQPAGGVQLRDANGDGLVERVETTSYVVRIDRYEETASGCEPVRLQTLAVNPPDLSDPLLAAKSWLFALYNGIDPFSDSGTDSGVSMQDQTDSTAYRPDIFTAFPRKSGDPDDIAFTDARSPYDEGLPQAKAVLLSNNGTRASVRLTDASDTNPDRLASVRLQLERNTGTPEQWRVTEAIPEACTAFCLAEDVDNVMRLTRTPVFLSAKEAASGYAPLLSMMEQKTGLEVASVRLDGNRVQADLPESMRLYLNQGSTGSGMRVNTLVRTLLTLPGAACVRVTIAGESDVEMDHYSFKGFFRLDEADQLQLVPDTVPAYPKTAEETAERLFTALAGQQWETMARFADPAEGVTLGIYGFMTDDAVMWDRMDWLSIPWDDRRKDFGFYDGSGFRIRLPAKEWLADFFVPKAPQKGWTRQVETGDGGHSGDLSVAPGRWPDAVRITYRWPGTSQYDGLDWRTLTFVLERSGSGWRLLGLISNQWTI